MKNAVRLIIGTILGLGIAYAAFVFLATHSGHPNTRASDFVPNAVKAAVQPWPVRAKTMLERMLSGGSAEPVASSSLAAIHPTGKSPKLAGFEVLPNGDGLSVKMKIDWQGGILGTAYSTIIVWELNEKNHIRAAATQDNSPTGIADPNAKQLDDYFRTDFYPILCKNLQ